MNAPLVERRALPERIEVKIEPVGRTCRVFKITERWSNTRASSKRGQWGKVKAGLQVMADTLYYTPIGETCKQ
jgi:hypothetical protein